MANLHKACTVAPTSTTKHPNGAKEGKVPFPDIAAHIIEHEGIGGFSLHRTGSFTVDAIPSYQTGGCGISVDGGGAAGKVPGIEFIAIFNVAIIVGVISVAGCQFPFSAFRQAKAGGASYSVWER